MASPAYYTYTPDRPRVNPLLLAARRCIEEARDDAKRFKNGEPTSDALDALMWILDTLDWTKLKRPDGTPFPIPPRELRADFVFSFDWCCRLLETTPEKVRAVGLPTTRLFNQNSTGGVAAIYEAWAEQRAAWLRKQESESNLALEYRLRHSFQSR